MITLTAKIELLKSGENDGGNGILSGATLSPNTLSGNNASAEIGAIINSKKTIKTPFVFGKSVLGGGDAYYGNLDYFMGRELSDESGNFASTYTIDINGTNINAVTFAFDDRNNAFPQSMIVDGRYVADDDVKWTVGLETADTHTITISNWNKPNSPLIISGIYIDLNLDINRYNMTSLESSLFDRADTSMPSFGIISNTGSIAFNDINGEIKDYAEQQILKSGLNVIITLNNTLTRKSEVVGTLKTADWDYDNYNRAVNISLKDDLEEWQEINVAEFYFDLRWKKKQPLKYFYDYLYDKTPKKYNMLSFDELDEKTKDILENTIVSYPYLEKNTLWQQWQKLCEVAQLHIYKQNNRVICIYKEGN